MSSDSYIWNSLADHQDAQDEYQVKTFVDIDFHEWKNRMIQDMEFLAVSNPKIETLFDELEEFDIIGRDITSLEDVEIIRDEMDLFENRFAELI